MTDEQKKALENIVNITQRKAVNIPSKKLDLGVDWCEF